MPQRPDGTFDDECMHLPARKPSDYVQCLRVTLRVAGGLRIRMTCRGTSNTPHGISNIHCRVFR